MIQIFEENGHQVDKIKCEDVTSSYIKDNRDKFFIVSNFMRLNKGPKEELMKVNYALYEHDHKYVINRNPAAFADLKVPDQQLDNLDLYKNANAVFCQSKIHKRAIDTNVQTKETINLGSSLWSPEFLDKIEKIAVNKTKKAAIVEERNPIKQQQLAENFCVENNIEYDLIRADTPLELATILSQYEFLVFFPKVLETFSRVAVEAKMVGCKLYTNNLLGAASEDWFKEDRSFVINQMKKARTKTYKSFLDVINNGNKSIQSSSDITVILNAYRRPYNLEKQIESIRNQTVKPNQIWLWINQHEDNKDFDFSELKVDRVFHNDYNWKYYGRFAAA